ncbi:hypothetical protein EPUL_004731, partial [Erysiphe pulchra]
SKNGWTTNELGLEWLKHFDRYTKTRHVGVYRLLILDGHESHNSQEFKDFCEENKIITLCMPPHSSHILQPLDVCCFAVLKVRYSQRIRALAQRRVFHIDKIGFLPAFRNAFFETFTEANIRSSFRGAGLTSPGLPLQETLWQSRTPSNTLEFGSQTKLVQNKLGSSPSSVKDGFLQLVKGAELMLHQNTLMVARIQELEELNDELTKRKGRKRKWIQTGGVLKFSETSQAVTSESPLAQQSRKKAYGGDNQDMCQDISRTLGGQTRYQVPEQLVYHLTQQSAKRISGLRLLAKGILAAAAKNASFTLQVKPANPYDAKLVEAVLDNAKVYAAGREDKEIIDKTFDKLHEQSRLYWTKIATPFSFPVFVIFKNSNGVIKGRPVIDIRALNHIAIPDAYPIPTKMDIIAAVSGCKYISTIDCASFFYQWKVAQKHQHRLTVSSHRGQETFSCAVMGFRNSPAYIQRVIDTILRQERDFARAYMDDILIFSKSFDEHIKHFKIVFTKLLKHNIHLSPKKCFLNYPSVALLGQRVDALGLSSSEDKLQAISKLTFPCTLKQLEYYLCLTSWLRQYISHYAKRAAALQAQKMKLYQILRTKGISTGPKRAREASRLYLENPTHEEIESFRSLQEAFKNVKMLVHFNPEKRLYLDIDSSGKEVGVLNPILSRLLKPAETRYWPTELEIAGLCWVIAKIRYLIESSKHRTIIYTDHQSLIQIATQTSRTTTSLVRLNPRHLRSSEYLSQFRLEENQSLESNAAILPFECIREILYAKPDAIHQERRRVIPKTLEREIFTFAHDQLGHIGFDRTHQRIVASFYVFDITKKLRNFIYHCHQCRVSSTPRHQPYGNFQPILTPPYLFHTISIDFILALPKTPDLLDCALTVTDKLSKAITIIPGRLNWTASQWGNALIQHLLTILWGVQRAIISDRDRKFISEVWRDMMDMLGVKLLFSTVWHLQIDGASERTNQTVEIALRYYLASLENRELWPREIPNITATLSNSTSRGTGVTSIAIMYGARIKEPLDIASDAIVELIEEIPQRRAASVPVYPIEPANNSKYKPALIEAIDAIKFAAIFMKRQYDNKHKPIFFNVGDYVPLRLHRDYNIPGVSERNTKIEQQSAGPFKIIERIGRLPYKLELPPAMKIHPVVSIAHLEPAPNPNSDPFERPFAQTIIQNSNLIPERILRKRTLRRRGGGTMTS